MEQNMLSLMSYVAQGTFNIKGHTWNKKWHFADMFGGCDEIFNLLVPQVYWNSVVAVLTDILKV